MTNAMSNYNAINNLTDAINYLNPNRSSQPTNPDADAIRILVDALAACLAEEMTSPDILQGRVYTASKARQVADQLQDSDKNNRDAFIYRAEVKGEFGRVKVYSSNCEFLGYF